MTKLERLPIDFAYALVDFVNSVKSKKHVGLFTEKITVEDFMLLLTTGKPTKIYHCETNSHFAFLAYYLAVEKELLDKNSYMTTICSGEMLYSKDHMCRRKLVKGIPLRSTNLNSGRTYINLRIAPYSTIIDKIDELCRSYYVD